ncbi:unnamed protein product, partial [Durusdinium trenchii]
MVAFSGNLPGMPQDLEYLELFAGVANVFSEARKANRNALACDVEYGQHFGFAPDSNPFDFMSPSGFALCIWAILNAREDEFWVLMGTVCSSWVHMNVGTSK